MFIFITEIAFQPSSPRAQARCGAPPSFPASPQKIRGDGNRRKPAGVQQARGNLPQPEKSEVIPLKKLFAALTALCLALLPDALAEPESAALLHIVAYGEETGQYPLRCSGECTAEMLLDGLTALTEHNFAYDRVETDGRSVTVVWSDEATFLHPEEAPMEVESLGLIFYDIESTLQFMLDTARATLLANLDIERVYYATAASGGLSFPGVTDWRLPAGQAYSEEFAAYYPQDYAFEDAREIMGDAGENIAPADAAQIVYDQLAAGAGEGWRIVLADIGQIDGSEGYVFRVGTGEGEGFIERFGALVTYDGGLYVRKPGEETYTFCTTWR